MAIRIDKIRETQMPLTPQEKDFCDHFDYESQDLSGGRHCPPMSG